MKTILATIILSATLAAPLMSTAADKSSVSDQALAQRELSEQLAQIRSAADLQHYLRVHPREATPLGQLTPGAQKRFLQSLVFTDNGLASFDYTDIRAELSASQIYQILGLFGREQSTASIPKVRVASEADRLVMQAIQLGPDYQDYWCSTPHTCDRRTGSICIVPGC